MFQFIDIKYVEKLYVTMAQKIDAVRRTLGRPLTLTEKILYSHLGTPQTSPPYEGGVGGGFLKSIQRGKTSLNLKPDRVCMQDATAQMAILQFMSTGIKKVKTPTSVHCDHLIRAQYGARKDLPEALHENEEVYNFLRSASQKYGMDFWRPGAGIIHQTFLENYAYPGGLAIGTDSHTPTAGGLGMLAIGVGGADAAEVMSGMLWQVAEPQIIGVHLSGVLTGWSSPKDVILYLCGLLTAEGGTGKILEFFGEGCASISCTGKGTITNMGAELGATTSIFPYDERMAVFLRATGRKEAAALADAHAEALKADKEVEENPSDFYDRVIEINLSQLESALNGPDTPDAYHPISRMKQDFPAMNLPERIAVCLIGSCTNSSYEDMTRAAAIARDGYQKGLRVKTGFMITPGSNQILETMKRDGYVEAFEKVGGTILANACGPCIGQWKRDDIKEGEQNVIVNSFNRNFKRRNDGRTETCAFVTSPELVVALAFAGKLTFNPQTDTIRSDKGEEVKLAPPPQAPDVPSSGYAQAESGFVPPSENADTIEVVFDPQSERLAALKPFPAWRIPEDFINLAVLVKAKGKCTTDHISPAGKWLAFRGHLENISKNLFSGVTNAFYEDAVGKGKNIRTGEIDELQAIAKDYSEQGIGWIAIGDENYGEGSSREHAAMEPRFLGCRCIIAKSYARIAETNLKKQGILPLWFKNPSDWEKVQADDRVTITDIGELAADKEVMLEVCHADGACENIITTHTLNEEEIHWFNAGSALNKISKDLAMR